MQDQGVTINGVWLEVRFEESAEGVEGAVLRVGGGEVGGFYVRLEVRLSLGKCSKTPVRGHSYIT